MNGYYMEQKPPESAGFSITSMVLGIVSMVLFCIYYVSFPCAIIGLIFGAISLVCKKPGKYMAIAGIVCSIITISILATIVIAGAAFMGYAINQPS